MASQPKPRSRQPLIVVVEDDPNMTDLLRMALRRDYRVRHAGTAPAALQLVVREVPDLILLDLNLPGMDGFTLCGSLQRLVPSVPIIIVSGRATDKDKVRALDLGADDYLTKPFNLDELLARVRAVLRRTQRAGHPPEEVPDVFACGPLRIDFVNREVSVGNRVDRLTPTEYQLLRILVANAGRLLPHAVLLQRVWGPECQTELDYLRVFIRRLRQKIEPNPDEPMFILTQARAGYRFSTPQDGASESPSMLDSAMIDTEPFPLPTQLADAGHACTGDVGG